MLKQAKGWKTGKTDASSHLSSSHLSSVRKKNDKNKQPSDLQIPNNPPIFPFFPISKGRPLLKVLTKTHVFFRNVPNFPSGLCQQTTPANDKRAASDAN